MKYDKSGIDQDKLLKLYGDLLLPRLIEEKMLLLLRQGRSSKWLSGIGQEAISVGVANAMDDDEFILPMHRNLGVFTTRGIEVKELFAQFQGKANGFTQGRDRSLHFGSIKHHIVGMISHLGPQMGVADGIALASNLRKEHKSTLVFTGDGGTSEGDFHESLNVAAVWDLPVIFAIENNGYGLSTPSSEQFRFKNFVDKAQGYGVKAVKVDGNNILEVYKAVKKINEEIRKTPGPYILECMTFRMRGHEEASGTKYVPDELFEKWKKKDPIDNYEEYLLSEGILSEAQVNSTRNEIKLKIDQDISIAGKIPDIEPDTNKELTEVFAPFIHKTELPVQPSKTIRFIDAVSKGLREAMLKHDNLVLMGQDIAEYGGVFKATEGFVEEFGRDRVRNTPLCESAIVGAGLGLSIKGMKSMVEMQFADFVSEAFNQIVNNLAKIHYRWGQNADVVIRMPTGAGVAAGPFHSQSNEAWFFHVPGLKIAYPSNPYDAKGLLLTSFEDPNPVMFFEHKALYRSSKGEVPEGYYNIEFGKAAKLKEGESLTIITYGMGVSKVLESIERLGLTNVDLIDLRTLAPLDKETIFDSVKKTGKALIIHEDNITGGIGGEISAMITESCFEYLDGPVKRLGAMDTPVPFVSALEENYLPFKKIDDAINEILSY